MSIIICPECGKEMSDAAISCPNCGKPNTDIAQNKPKPNTDISQNKRHIGFWLGAGIVLFPIIFSWFTLRKGHSTKAKVIAFSWLALYLVFYSGSKHDLQQKTSPSSQISSSAVQETSTVSDGTTYKIGETFQVGYTSYSVWNAQWRKRLSDNQFLDQAPDANWLFVRLTVRNDDKKPRSIAPFKLVDEAGAEYETSAKSWSVQGSIGILASLNPGVEKSGYIVFDVPKNHTYKLKVSGGYWSSKNALVELAI